MYQDGVNSIRLSYDSAARALKLDTERAYDEISDYNAKVLAGDQSGIERDEDGQVLWDEADVLVHRSLQAEDALNTLRKAFVIVLYHHWERSVREWVKSKNGKHDALVTAAAAIGQPTDPLLDDLRLLVNTLKHDNERWAEPLHKKRADLFKPEFKITQTDPDWYNEIEVSGTALLDFFSAVSASGPTTNTP
jgi:hypothetical protein